VTAFFTISPSKTVSPKNFLDEAKRIPHVAKSQSWFSQEKRPKDGIFHLST
jgi:hypothetical protein